MGDARYDRPYEHLRQASDRDRVLRRLTDEEVIEALAAASRQHDPFLANVLATNALNRVRRLRAALMHLGEGVVTLGARGEVTWSNPAADRILQWRREDAMGKPFEDSVDHFDPAGDPVPADRCRLLRTALSGEPAHSDGDHFKAKGAPRVCVEYTSAPVLAPDGGVEGAVLAFRECGQRKISEREQRESRERYKSLFDNAPEGIISLTTDGIIVDANAAAVALTSRPIAETKGQAFALYLHADDVASTMALFASVLSGRRERARLRILHKAGHYVEVEATGVPILVDGEVVGVHGLIRPALSDGKAAGP